MRAADDVVRSADASATRLFDPVQRRIVAHAALIRPAMFARWLALWAETAQATMPAAEAERRRQRVSCARTAVARSRPWLWLM